jgi:hypothetical protein
VICISTCDMDLLGVGKCSQIIYSVHHTVSCCNSVTSLSNRLYADSPVHHWCCSEDPSTVQLLIDTTAVLQYILSLCASLSTHNENILGAGYMIP